MMVTVRRRTFSDPRASAQSTPAASAAVCGLAGSGSGECWDAIARPLADDSETSTAQVVAAIYEDAAAAAADRDVQAIAAAYPNPASQFRFLQGRIRYLSDPDSVRLGAWRPATGGQGVDELVIPPADLLSMSAPAGDCDEYASAAVALAWAAGRRAWLRTAAADPEYPDSWSHIYALVEDDDGVMKALDASHGRHYGWEARPGETTRFRREVEFIGARKDWKHMDAPNIAGIRQALEEAITPAVETGLRVIERRYANPPTGTYRVERNADGSELVESFGSAGGAIVPAGALNIPFSSVAIVGAGLVAALIAMSVLGKRGRGR